MKIFWFVVTAHLIALLAVGIQKRQKIVLPERLEIHTVRLSPPPKVVSSSEAKCEPIVEAKHEVMAEPKKEVVAAAPKKPALSPKKKTAQASSELRQLLQKSIASLESGKTMQIETPQKVGQLKSEALTYVSYETLLVEYLRELLELPQIGLVRLSLTVSRQGSVLDYKILEASAANRAYVEREIVDLRLPSFEGHFKNEESHTFPITLKTY